MTPGEKQKGRENNGEGVGAGNSNHIEKRWGRDNWEKDNFLPKNQPYVIRVGR